jgi:hypothetical protein
VTAEVARDAGAGDRSLISEHSVAVTISYRGDRGLRERG